MKNNFMQGYRSLAGVLLKQRPIHTGEWHAQDTSNSPMHSTYELLDVGLDYDVTTVENAVQEIHPNLPWADEHFKERVSGIPYNPPPSHVNWPWAHANARHQDSDDKFSHTYPERFWPKDSGRRKTPKPLGQVFMTSGEDLRYGTPDDPGPVVDTSQWAKINRRGIRYDYGDLNDVVELLVRSPLTRQAYLPVWFPEDTGAVEHQRVPCTLGYHFMIRDGRLHCWYPMRSCDFVRHLQDDMYLAVRLMIWVTEQYLDLSNIVDITKPVSPIVVPTLKPGTLHMTISSLHAFFGDRFTLENIAYAEIM